MRSQVLRAGNIGINTVQRNHETPFGGTKLSGVGGTAACSGARVHRVPVDGVAGVTVASPGSIVPDGALVYGISFRCRRVGPYVGAWEHEDASQDLVDVAQACDEAGFFYVAVCDHVAMPREPAG